MLLHADDSPDSFPLRRQVAQDLELLSDGTMHTWFLNRDQDSDASSFTGFMDVNAVELPLDAEYYLCGPLPFLQSVRSSLISKGVPPKDWRKGSGPQR